MASVEQSEGSKFVFVRTFDEVYEYPLSDSLPLIVCIVIAYLLFVLKIGPAFMKNREPYKLKNTILVYNAIQVILSVYFAYLTAIPLFMRGLIPKRCCEEEPEVRKLLYKAVYAYWLGKITELLDTVFFILRKKYNQVTFLHVYHHSSVVLGSWMIFKYSINQTAAYGAFINAVVHVVMYFYYFMAALGPQYQKYLTWKKHITTFQLIQFVSMFSHQAAMLIFSKNCTHSILGLLYVFPSTILFFVLFHRFYKQSYKKSNNVSKKQNVQNSEFKENVQNGISHENSQKMYAKTGNGATVVNRQLTKPS